MMEDPDTWEMSDAAFDRPLRADRMPALRDFLRRRSKVVSIDIDREVAERLGEGPERARRANALLRKAVGLE
jgi:hypothetical protein